ncbi:helix-turn-helix domain-containing protein [Saccharopolyspora cebuensis]|uniref:Helix-turn-helix domain-containing protein n=1 Tax=Saccharopolyspora cebuensis TaxID=418759 RepID=A0ABV4CJK0_9PSEU
MARLSRAEAQRLNRGKVLRAAREEFAERGFREAKVDRIAERAELTRGAVYSNFPGKRALYFAVLAEAAENAPVPAAPDSVRAGGDALGAFARTWLSRLPLATDERHGDARIDVDLIPEVLGDPRIRRPFAQLVRVDALLLGLALERLDPGGRRVRAAAAALTALHGASRLAAAAPGFGEPFDVARTCARLADQDFDDAWHPPSLAPPAQPADEPWSPPEAADLVRGRPARLDADGVVAVLGVHRLSGVEDAVRAAPADARVTAVAVTEDPGELAGLVRLAIADLGGCLRASFPERAWPGLQVVCDSSGVLAAAAGVPAVRDDTEVAVRIEAGRVVSRAEGLGACHAAAVPARH